jgi:hypothetical protein
MTLRPVQVDVGSDVDLVPSYNHQGILLVRPNAPAMKLHPARLRIAIDPETAHFNLAQDHPASTWIDRGRN